MNGDLIEATERAVAEAIATILVGEWLLGCQSHPQSLKNEVMSAATTWIKGNDAIVRAMKTSALRGFVGSHLDQVMKETAPECYRPISTQNRSLWKAPRSRGEVMA